MCSILLIRAGSFEQNVNKCHQETMYTSDRDRAFHRDFLTETLFEVPLQAAKCVIDWNSNTEESCQEFGTWNVDILGLKHF